MPGSKKKTILIQLDADDQPSAFDRVVAIDAGVDEVFSYSGVTIDQVQALVHGAIFTRGGKSLRRTAIFVGGTDVGTGEQMLEQVRSSFFGPLSVSVMMDANGANTTAAAAVLSAARHLDLSSITALVLAGTGPVGQRAARLLARQGAAVRLASRSQQRADAAAGAINHAVTGKHVRACTTQDDQQLRDATGGADLIICAGAAGVELLAADVLAAAASIKVAIDLNAVPPLGIEGVQVTAEAAKVGHVIAYGAIGVGRLKMRIHKAAITSLFESNDRVLDAEQIYELGKEQVAK